eukprot:6458877-Amphidinium_carterae.4
MVKNKADARSLAAASSSEGTCTGEKKRKVLAKKQLEFGGFRTCALCKASSKDTPLVVCCPLRRRQMLGPFTPAMHRGNNKRKVMLARHATMCGTPASNTWNGRTSLQTCSTKYDSDAKYKGIVDGAVQAFLNPGTEKDFPDADVLHETWLGLELHRPVVLLTERDMKRMSGERDLSKSTLKQVPCFTVPKEDGDGTEQVWCFKDPTAEVRKGNLKTSVGSLHREWVAAKQSMIHAQQAEDSFVASHKRWGQEVGTQDVIEKEQRGNLKLMTWETFMPKLQKEREEDLIDDVEAQVTAMQETAVTLIGPSALKNQFLTPPSDTKKRPARAGGAGTLLRAPSSQSVCAGSHSSDPAPTSLAAAFAQASAAGSEDGSNTVIDDGDAAGVDRREWNRYRVFSLILTYDTMSV